MKYCVSAPTFNAAAPAQWQGTTPVSATNSFAPSTTSVALADSGSQGQTATVSNGAVVSPLGVYFPAGGNPYVQFPGLQFGGGDVTIGAMGSKRECRARPERAPPCDAYR